MTNDITYEQIDYCHLEGLLTIWSDDDVIRYTAIKSACTRDDVFNRITILKDNNVFVVLQNSNVIGIIGCPLINLSDEFGLFYQFNKSVWGKGIATTCVGWLLNYMQQKYNNLVLHADVITDNVASEKILKKYNFNLVGKDNFEKNGHIMKIHNYVSYNAKDMN